MPVTSNFSRTKAWTNSGMKGHRPLHHPHRIRIERPGCTVDDERTHHRGHRQQTTHPARSAGR